MPGSSSGSWGFLIRDSDGDVVMTGRGRWITAERISCGACLQGVQTTIGLGIGHLLEEVMFLVASSFLSFECLFKDRECCQVAHELAALGFSLC